MSIRIEREKCTGCTACMDICPGNLIAMGPDGKALCRRPYDCWGCTACLKSCRQSAIILFLEPELGGRGESLTVKKEGTRYLWAINNRSKNATMLSTDTKKAN
ncbi:MAG: ferredoxin family protein, partial [Lachnospiraceae bacterium]|nr:ferredoxin family protein [Lachnospiraceae bacterium]